MVTKILDRPEIWSIPMELPQNPLRVLNVYVIRTDAGNLVIDTGFRRPECREVLWDAIGELGLNLSHTSLFLTHLHSDHIGLAQDFADRGCTIYMGETDYDYFCSVQTGGSLATLEALFLKEGFPPEELARQSTENQGRQYAPERIFPAVTVRGGARLHLGGLELCCLHTPGHTPGHMALYLPEAQVLFSGDHILFDITPNISVWAGVPHSLADYLESLQALRPLPVRLALPAHRSPREGIAARIDELLEHHRARLDEVELVVRREPDLTAHDVAGRISWSARGKPWSEFPPHQRWFAMGETLAHLSYLADAGRVARREGKNSVRYDSL